MHTLILHIGHPKCGSTTIQNFLYENRSELAKHGFGIANKHLKLMPRMGRQTSKIAPVRYFAEIRSTLPESTDRFRSDLVALFDSNKAAGNHTLIISAENLTHPELSTLFGALDLPDCQIRVVYYIRRQDDWVLSSWKQWASKAGASLEETIKVHLNNPKPQYKDILTGWCKAVGRENISVGLLDRNYLKGGNLLEDFTHRLGLNMNGFTSPTDANISLNHHLVHGLSKSPFLFDGPHDSKLTDFLKKYFGPLVAKSNESPISVDDRRAILAAHAEENAWLQAEFFSDSDLSDWLKIIPRYPHRPPSDMDAMLQMQAISIKLMADIIKKQK